MNKTKRFLPSDVRQMFINDDNDTVTVELKNGNKGTSICGIEDTFDPYVGYCIAYDKAKNVDRYHFKEALQNCINYSKKKKYTTAIFKNIR